MTVEDAIKILKEYALIQECMIEHDNEIDKEIFDCDASSNISKKQALDMAIESLEKQIPKECVVDSCPDHTHYKCPSCGQIQMSTYAHGFPRLGRITKHCENCGQALQMESDSVDK